MYQAQLTQKSLSNQVVFCWSVWHFCLSNWNEIFFTLAWNCQYCGFLLQQSIIPECQNDIYCLNCVTKFDIIWKLRLCVIKNNTNICFQTGHCNFRLKMAEYVRNAATKYLADIDLVIWGNHTRCLLNHYWCLAYLWYWNFLATSWANCVCDIWCTCSCKTASCSLVVKWSCRAIIGWNDFHATLIVQGLFLKGKPICFWEMEVKEVMLFPSF